MKQITWLVVLASVVQWTFAPDARAVDVIGTNTAIVIEKTKQSKLTFKLCSFKIKKCEQLGKTTGYTKQELLDQKLQEQLEAAGVTVLAAGAVVAIPYIWFYGGLATVAIGMSTGATAVPLLLTFGGMGASAYGGYRGVKSAVSQFRQVGVLRDEIIEDRDFSKSDEKILRIAEDLKTVLEKI